MFFFLMKSPAPPLGYLGHSAHIPRSSSISFIHNMYRYSIQVQDGPVWSGLEIISMLAKAYFKQISQRLHISNHRVTFLLQKIELAMKNTLLHISEVRYQVTRSNSAR